jgi:hypothetical protein
MPRNASKVKVGTKQLTLQLAISRFGVSAKSKLSNPTAKGQPEDQLRAPIEKLVVDLATLQGLGSKVTLVGEYSIK